jgi:prephenate dehydrogenase
MMRIHIVGAGLVGTSIGLVLAAQGDQVSFSDTSKWSAQLAQDLVGGHPPRSAEQFDLLIAAVPTEQVSAVIIEAFKRNLADIFMDISSVKTKCVLEIESFDPILAARYCGTHPMAGREVSGPESAQADLFQGRPWILTPTPVTSQATIDLVSTVVKAAGATEVQMSPIEHDQAMALVSHAPQVLASLMAGELTLNSPTAASLAGQGLRDVTRIAASDSQLWLGILSANASALRPILTSLHHRLGDFITSIEGEVDASAVTDFLNQGRVGRDLLPGKHGGKRQYVVLPVLIADAPGQLKRLFNDAGDADINIEDVSMEHSPGHPTGLVQISVAPESAERLENYLRERGWRIYPPRNPDSLP